MKRRELLLQLTSKKVSFMVGTLGNIDHNPSNTYIQNMT